MPFWTGRRAFGGILLAVVLITLGWAAVVVSVAIHAAHDEATGADAIVVLGAAQYNGRPSPVFRARLDHAATLYQRGLAPTVLVTGDVGARDSLNEANVGRDRKSTRLNSSHRTNSYAVFCLKKKKNE